MIVTHRPKLTPDFTIEEWLKKHPEVDQQQLLFGSAYISAVALSVMGTAGITTKRSGGKRSSALKKILYTQEIHKRYLKDLTYTQIMVPLNMENEADQAYVRVVEKRNAHI